MSKERINKKLKLVNSIYRHRNVCGFEDKYNCFFIKIHFWKGTPNKSVYIPSILYNKRTKVELVTDGKYR